MVGADKCWFPHLKTDCKDKFLSASQISKMIKKCVVQNNCDGTIHQITKIAGPFCNQNKLLN